MNVASAAFDSDKPRNENESRRREEREGGRLAGAMSSGCGALPPFPSVCSQSVCGVGWLAAHAHADAARRSPVGRSWEGKQMKEGERRGLE